MRNKKLKLKLNQSIFAAITLVIVFFSTIMLVSNYLINANITKSTAKTEAKEISTQILSNYENYIDSLINDFTYLEFETNNNNVRSELLEKYNTIVDSRRGRIEIALYNMYDEEILTTGITGTVKNDFFNEIRRSVTYHSFSRPYQVSEETFMQIGKVITYRENETEVDGILIIESNFDAILEVANSANLGERGYILFVDNTYELVFSSSSELCKDSSCHGIEQVKKLVLGNGIIKTGSEYFALNIQTLENTRWKAIIFINVNTFYASMTLSNTLLYSLSAGVIVVAVFLSSFISRRVSNPLKKLEETMKKVEEGNFEIKTNIKDKGAQIEIIMVANRFDNMVIKINELMESVLTVQTAKRKTELKALQNQINPHFLYNTLDSIAFLAHNGQNKEVEEMVVALAKFFRISISKGKVVISVAEELDHVKNYMLIQSIRFKDAFKFEINATDEVKELKTMKLILQPFVENSICHGLKNFLETDFISINVTCEDGFVVYRIKDNGLGIRESKIAEIYENMKNPNLQNSVGIKNVYQRLKLFYGESAEITFVSELDEYTEVTIKIPANKTLEDM